MLEFKRRQGSKKYQLVVNGILLPDAEVDGTPSNFDVTIKGDKASKEIICNSFSDVFRDIVALRLDLPLPWNDLTNAVYIYRRGQKKSYDLIFAVEFDPVRWKRLWSSSEYLDAFGEVVKLSEIPRISFNKVEDTVWYGFELTFNVHNPKTNVATEVSRYTSLLTQLNERTESLLSVRVHDGSVVLHFDFPDEVRVPCEQYLLYFVQFLRDLGIEATAELEHEASQVLFAVKPSDAKEALDKIRIALEVYMSLPSTPIDDSSLDSEIAIQRLAANIYHLKGQLSLAHAELQANERTIQAQQFVIESQQRLLSGEILLESAKDVSNPELSEDKEELLKGALAITKYKGKGFEINLPEVYRRLKQFLTRKE